MSTFFNKKKIVCSTAILMTCIIGDRNSTPQHDIDFAAAISDNMAHAFISMLTWLGVRVLESHTISSKTYAEVVLCGLWSSLIDLDHFLSARSFSLKNAVNLKKRPLFHCTTLTLFASSILVFAAVKLKFSWLYRFGWLLITAILSHHIRDGTRRGLWLWPFGSTKPIPYVVYLALEAFLPDLIYIQFTYGSIAFQRNLEQNIVETV